MKRFSCCVPATVAIVLAMYSEMVAADHQDKYLIRITDEDPPTADPYRWELVAADVAFFESRGSRPQTMGETPSASPFRSAVYHEFDFEASPNGNVWIRALKLDKRSPRPVKYLSVDYDSDSPIVITRDKPDESCEWRIVHSDKDKKSFIESMHPGKEKMKKWLTVDSKPIVVPITGKDKVVVEYRRVVLSADKRDALYLMKLDSEK